MERKKLGGEKTPGDARRGGAIRSRKPWTPIGKETYDSREQLSKRDPASLKEAARRRRSDRNLPERLHK